MPRYEANEFTPAAPVATVVHRNPGSAASLADVPMLIDSGADIKLPQAAVEILGIVPSASDVDGLVSFDGSASVSKAVLADLVFCRKVFKGRYLLIN